MYLRKAAARFFRCRRSQARKPSKFQFRQDLNQALVIQVMIAGLQALTSSEVLSHASYSFAQMSHIVATLVLEGDLTEEGRRLTAARAEPPRARS